MRFKVSLTIVNGLLVEEKFTVTEHAQCMIGRAKDCDIWFPTDRGHWNISRHHCVLAVDPAVDPPTVQVRDLGSVNGTYVNGRRIGGRRQHQPVGADDFARCPFWGLQDGDEVQVGNIVFRVRVDPSEMAETGGMPTCRI